MKLKLGVFKTKRLCKFYDIINQHHYVYLKYSKFTQFTLFFSDKHGHSNAHINMRFEWHVDILSELLFKKFCITKD